MSTPNPTPMPMPVPEFIVPRYEYPDHQRLEHRDIKASIDREGCHTRDEIGDLSAKVGEGLLASTLNVKDQIADDYCKLQGSIHRTGEYVGDKVDRTNLYLGDKTDGSKVYLGDKVDRSNLYLGNKVEDTKDKVVDKVDASKVEVKDTQDRYYISAESNAESRAKALLDAIHNHSNSLASDTAAIRTEVAGSRERLQEQLFQQNTTNVSAHQNTILELTKDVADIKYETAKGFGQASLEHCRDTGILSKQMSEGFSATQLEAAKNFAAIQLEAKQNKFELSQQLAECCCEMKEKLIETASATQQLIQANETSRLRDSLASANNENLFLRFAQGSSTVGGGSGSRC